MARDASAVVCQDRRYRGQASLLQKHRLSG